jgi:hypothetical protein
MAKKRKEARTMTNLQKLKEECLKLNATLDLEKWDITAPKGFIFTATQCHYIVFRPCKEDSSHRWGKAPRQWNKIEWEVAYKDALKRLSLGIEPDLELDARL